MNATLWRGLGALLGGGGGVGAGFVLRAAYRSGAGATAGAIGALVVVVLVLYLIARPSPQPGSTRTEMVYGILLGLNTGINVVLMAFILTPVIGVVAAIVFALGIVVPVAQNDAYQGVIGWSNFLLPMSWIVTGLGLTLMLLSLILWGVTGGQINFFKITSFTIDGKTGTFFIVGGLAGNANLNPNSTGFNMGNFAFLRASASEYLTEHEAGHTLNLAALGFVFHFIGALDENVFGGHQNAFSELFAESNVPPAIRQGPTLPLWGV